MPPVTFESDTCAPPANDRPQPSASWQDRRSERVRKLEAELVAVKERRKDNKNISDGVPLEPDYGSMLDGENSDSSDSDTRSDSSSLFYSEGQPLLCTYQPLAYPGNDVASYGATDAA
ncbi:hypothetical protein IWW50_004365, partial [Coemansia erecta]